MSTSFVHAQGAGGGGSTSGPVPTGEPVPSSSSLTPAPSSAPPSTPPPSSQPPQTPAPTVTTTAPPTTPPPTATPKTHKPEAESSDSGSKLAGESTPKPSATAANVTTAPPALQSTVVPSTPAVTKSLAPGVIPKSGASYGTVDSGGSKGAKTQSGGNGDSKSMINILIAALGGLGVVMVIGISVCYRRKRTGDDDHDLLSRRTTKAGTPGFSTLASAVPHPTKSTQNHHQTLVVQGSEMTPQAIDTPTIAPPNSLKQVSELRESETAPPSPGHDLRATARLTVKYPTNQPPAPPPSGSGIVATAANFGVSATFLARNGGENDVTGGDEDLGRLTKSSPVSENFRSPTAKTGAITKLFIDDADDRPSAGFDTFVFSDGTGSNVDDSALDSTRSNEFSQFYVGDRGTAKFVDGDESSVRDSNYSDRMSDFTVDFDNSRVSVSSSLADLHDSGRHSELAEEFEV